MELIISSLFYGIMYLIPYILISNAKVLTCRCKSSSISNIYLSPSRKTSGTHKFSPCCSGMHSFSPLFRLWWFINVWAIFIISHVFNMQVLSISLLASYPFMTKLSGPVLSIVVNSASMLKNIFSVSTNLNNFFFWSVLKFSICVILEWMNVNIWC